MSKPIPMKRRTLRPAFTLTLRVERALRTFGPATTQSLAKRLSASPSAIAPICARLFRAGQLLQQLDRNGARKWANVRTKQEKHG